MPSKSKIAKQIAEKAAAKGEQVSAKELLEQLLPVGSSDAAREALRKNPDQYEKYLKALDDVYGPNTTRAMETKGIDLPELQKAHDKAAKTKKEYDIWTSPVEQFDEAGEMMEEPVKDKLVGYANHKNDEVGRVPFTKDKYREGWVVDDIEGGPEDLAKVSKEHRRKGVASAIYNQLEKDTGLPVVPSRSQTYEGKALWNERNRAHYDAELAREYEALKTEKNPEELAKIKENIDIIKQNIIKDKAEYRPFGNERHPEAAFDPRFADSADIMAFNGQSTAKSPLDYLLKTKLGQQMSSKLRSLLASDAIKPLVQGAGDVGQAIEGLTAPINEPRRQFIEQSAKQMDLDKRGNEDFRKQAAGILDFVLPDATNLVPESKALGVAGKAERKTAAELLRDAKGFGKTIVVPEAEQAVGKVIRPVEGQSAAEAIVQSRLQPKPIVVEPVSTNAPRSILVKPPEDLP